MNRRFRTIGALLALLALSASFAEELWASTCMTDGAMPAAEVAADAAMSDASAGGMSGMDGMVMPTPAAVLPAQSSGGAQLSAPADPMRCPLTIVIGACAATSLPSRCPALLTPMPVQPTLAVREELARELLLVFLLPHPPRA